MGSIEERSIVTPIRRVLKGKAATWIWHLQDTLCCSNASYVSWDFPSSIWTWPQFSSRGHDDFEKQMPPQADFLEAKCEHVDVKNKVLRCGIWTKKWHSPMSYRFLPVGKSDQRIITDNFRKKIWFLGVIKYFLDVQPYVFQMVWNHQRVRWKRGCFSL